MYRKIYKIAKNILNMPFRLFSKVSIMAIVDNSSINKLAAISGNTRFYSSSIDKYSYIGRNCLVINTEIGKFTSIADNCFIGCSSHPTNWISTSPVFYKGKNILNKNFCFLEYESNKKTIIGNDVWIGCNVLIKSGVTIGDGAIIGMGSIVTKNIEPYSIVAGNPAKHIKYRFDEDIIEKIQNIKWWELDEKQLEEKAYYINNPDKFIKTIEKEI